MLTNAFISRISFNRKNINYMIKITMEELWLTMCTIEKGKESESVEDNDKRGKNTEERSARGKGVNEKRGE